MPLGSGVTLELTIAVLRRLFATQAPLERTFAWMRMMALLPALIVGRVQTMWF